SPIHLHSFPTRRSSDLPQFSLHHSCTLAHQGVGAGARHPYREVLTDQGIAACLGMREVQSPVVGSPADPLSESLVPSLHQDLLRSEEHTSELQSRENLV